jgi:hypothetical protein
MKTYKIFNESNKPIQNINIGDIVKHNKDYPYQTNLLYKVQDKFNNNMLPDSDDKLENMFRLTPLNIDEDTYLTSIVFHKDYIELASKEEIDQFNMEQAALKYNL